MVFYVPINTIYHTANINEVSEYLNKNTVPNLSTKSKIDIIIQTQTGFRFKEHSINVQDVDIRDILDPRPSTHPGGRADDSRLRSSHISFISGASERGFDLAVLLFRRPSSNPYSRPDTPRYFTATIGEFL